MDGRKEDYIILKNGTYLGRMDHIFKDLMNIREAQLYQKRPGEIFVRIVRGAQYTPRDENRLMQEIQKRTGEDTDIILQYVDSLERTSRGKLRFVISEIPESRVGHEPKK